MVPALTLAVASPGHVASEPCTQSMPVVRAVARQAAAALADCPSVQSPRFRIR